MDLQFELAPAPPENLHVMLLPVSQLFVPSPVLKAPCIFHSQPAEEPRIVLRAKCRRIWLFKNLESVVSATLDLHNSVLEALGEGRSECPI